MDAEFEIESVPGLQTGMQRKQPQAYGGFGPTRNALAGG